MGDGLPTPQSAQKVATTGLVVGYAWTQYFVMGVVLWFYAAACLYNERRDRSILFWKSMPVSDAKTVLSKWLMVLAVVPLYVYVVTLITTLVGSAILGIPRFSGPSLPGLWDGGAWVRAQVFVFVWLVLAMLWYAPLNAYLFAISAWARRNVQLWALSPIIAAIVERIAFGTHYLGTWMLYRVLPAWQGRQWFESVFGASGFFAPGQFFSRLEPLRGFENIDLWIGLAVAAALLYAAVRIRRYRDDT
jgi:ABC-2 type transport system permease protein